MAVEPILRRDWPGRYEIPGEAKDNEDGTYTISYVPAIPGKTQLSVMLDGEHVGPLGEDDPRAKTCGVSLGTDFTGSPWLIEVGGAKQAEQARMPSQISCSCS